MLSSIIAVNLLYGTSVYPHTRLARTFYSKTMIMWLVYGFKAIVWFDTVGIWFLSASFAWVAIKLTCLIIRVRVPNNKDHHTYSEPTEAGGIQIRRIPVSLCAMTYLKEQNVTAPLTLKTTQILPL